MDEYSKKDKQLVQGALRQAFSRSEFRRKILDSVDIEHKDPKRPRVTKWSRCLNCNQPTPRYLMQLDHVLPVVPLDSALEFMSLSNILVSIWCTENNLKPLCKRCHYEKSKVENKIRRLNRSKRGKKV